MIADLDLDIAIRGWVRASLVTSAPPEAVRAALMTVETTPQRRRHLGSIELPGVIARRPSAQRHLMLVAATLTVAIVGMAIGVGAIDRLHRVPTPSASEVPSPRPSTLSADPSERKADFRDEGIQVVIPRSWARVAELTPGLVHLVGDDGTTVSIYHGNPAMLVVCDPGCATISNPYRLPFDAASAREDARQRLGWRVDASDWRTVDGLNPRLVDPMRLDGDDLDPSGRPVRNVYLVSSYLNELIVIAVSMPRSTDTKTVDRLLASLSPYPAIVTRVGTPVRFGAPQHGFEVMIPDIWHEDTVAPADGIVAFEGGRVQISVSNAEGSMFVCDPSCRTVVASDLSSLEAATFSQDGGSLQVGDLVLSGSPGRYQVDASTTPSYRAIGIVDGTAVHILIRLEHDVVAQSVAEAIVASFLYAPPPNGEFVDGVLTGDGWELPYEPTRSSVKISVSAADAFRRFWMCTFSGWSTTKITCRIVVGDTLEQMAHAIEFGQQRTDAILDGEPAVVVRAEYYEYPARGGQWGAFIVAIHGGRPFYIRIQSGVSPGLPVDEVLEAFRFTD